MWLVFLLMMLSIFVVGLIIVYLANKTMIAMQKDNDEYIKTKEKEGKENG